MKFKALLAAGVVAALVVPAGADAASSRDKVTGGGQAFFDMRDPAGAGDTIAFQAQREKGAEAGSDAATGQIQVNRRGTNAVKFHGTITCLNVSGTPDSSSGYAYMSGMSRATKTTPAQPFELYVMDGGKGPQERNDMIMLFVGEETANNDSDNADANEVCGFSDPDFDTVSMARGNVQVRNNDTSEDDDPDAGTEEMAAPMSLPALLG